MKLVNSTDVELPKTFSVQSAHTGSIKVNGSRVTNPLSRALNMYPAVLKSLHLIFTLS